MPAATDFRRSGPAADLDDVQIELTLAIFHKLLVSAILGAAGLIWLSALIARFYQDSWMGNYARLATVFYASRILIIIAFNLRARPRLTLLTARRWALLYEAHTLAMCAMIAIGGFHIFQHLDLVAKVCSLLGVFCTLTFLTGRTGMRPWVLQLGSLMVFSTIAYSMLRSDKLLMRTSTVLIVLFLVTAFRSVRTQFDVWLEQVRGRHKLRELAERDLLTGLANRRHFQDTLDCLCQEQSPFAILYIDLDKFKAVNDTLGHAAGDTLLRLVAERLHACVRSSDLLARLGGDEFAILQWPLLVDADAEILAQRINLSIALPFAIDGKDVTIGASIGIDRARPGRMDPEQILQTADQALYHVKRAGGGSFSLGNAQLELR